MKQLFISSILLLTVLNSYGQSELFIDSDFSEYESDHKVIAVIPFNTSLFHRSKQITNPKEGQLERMQNEESLNIQQSMYSWLLKRKQQGNMWVGVQDVSTTNALLAKKEITYANIDQFTPTEIAEILGVDAVIEGAFTISQLMLDATSITIGITTGIYGLPTKKATLNMFIYNAENGRVLVSYSKTISGTAGSSNDQLINVMMRKVTRRIPYTKLKS